MCAQVLVNGRISGISSYVLFPFSATLSHVACRLERCTKLRLLNLSNNKILRIGGLRHNTDLRCLMLDSNPIAHIFAKDFGEWSGLRSSSVLLSICASTALTRPTEGLDELRQLYLCGTKVLNLWSTVAALKGLLSLRELYLCKEYHPLVQNSVFDRDNLDDIESEAETIVDMVVRRIGDLSLGGLERLSLSFRDLSGSLTHTLSGRLSPLTQWHGLLGERLHSNDLAAALLTCSRRACWRVLEQTGSSSCAGVDEENKGFGAASQYQRARGFRTDIGGSHS